MAGKLLALLLCALLAAVHVTADEALSSGVHVVGLHRRAHRARGAGRLAQLAGVPVVPVNGDVWPVAIFWSVLQVGNPPVSFPVAIDSGSDTLNIPLKGGGAGPPRGNLGETDLAATRRVPGLRVPAAECVLQPRRIADECAAPVRQRLRHELVLRQHLPVLQHLCTVGGWGGGFLGRPRVIDVCLAQETCDPHDPTAPCTISGPWYQVDIGFGSLFIPFTGWARRRIKCAGAARAPST